MKVLFLINDGFGIGGTITTTFNLAGALAARGHQVEVLSTMRWRDVPQLPLDPAVKLMSLVEKRPEHPAYDGDDPLRGKPAQYYPAADYRAADYDKMVEDRYERYLRTSDADVVIATRAGLIAYTARFAPPRMIRIGQEHLTRTQQRKAMRKELPRHINRLDAFVTITARDAEDYRRYLNLDRVKLVFIPNSVPVPTVPASHGRSRLVVAAGRLVESKRYDVLIRGFAKVAAKRPDWQLRIYGQGRFRDDLRQLVAELGLHNHVLMMGPYTPIETEWAKGAIAAVPSDREPFGMTLVEAMRVGVPVVSTDAPYGPAEILDDGVDGLLIPTGDPEAMGDALLRLIDDREERAAMAGAAHKNSERFDPAPIAERYETLFEQLAAGKVHESPRWWSRLRRTSVVEVLPPPVLGPAPTLTQATAAGEVTPTGDVVLRPGPAIAPGAELVWRRLGAGAAQEVPMQGLTVRAGDLADGAWQLFCPGGEPVHAASLDTRALVDLPVPEHGGVRVQLPYRLVDGGLALRVWLRPVHAEIGDLNVDDEGLHVDGRLIGAPLTGEPVLELRGPNGAIEQHAATALTSTTFRVDVPALAPGVWRLWLRYAPDATPVRLGRFLDDVIRKQTAYVLPAAGPLQPYFEGNNEFSVRVTEPA
jgi:glycosyltransferase involved in cell wall biosynthesis